MDSKFRFLCAHGASRELAQLWAAHARPHLELVRSEPAERDRSPVGASKLGGVPDGPLGSYWPRRSAYSYLERRGEHLPAVWQVGAYLSFLGQINLADASGACAVLPGLPEAGLLQLFYDTELQPWGFDPADRVGFQLLYMPVGVQLQRLDLPESEWSLAGPAAPLKLVRGSCLPDAGWIQNHLVESGWNIEKVWGVLDEIDDDVRYSLTPGGHHLGGWPSLIQNPLEVECELVANGIYCGGPEGYATKEAQRLKSGAHVWRQIFQIDSDDELGWMWGDVGRLYAMMRGPDIEALKFQKAHLVLQCS